MATNPNHQTSNEQPPSPDDRVPESQLVGIFTEYGITDGTVLIKDTKNELNERGVTEFSPTPAFADSLGTSFRAAFIDQAAIPIVPDAVDTAVTDAVPATIHEFMEKNMDDLRLYVLPLFYKRVVRFFAFAAAAGADIQAGVYFDDDGTGGIKTSPSS